ncbi:MAG: TSUP family transporter [Parachlamydiales bacterium]
MPLEYLLIALSAFIASLITFYSGFGLATLLMPVMAIFLPLPLAIGLTAIVHLCHNLAKSLLLYRAIRWGVVIRFGIPAILAAVAGAYLLRELTFLPPLATYTLWGFPITLTLLHLLIGLLLILFATLQLLPLPRLHNLYVGGVLSGFFGGLSGNQGAFRSLFLVNAIDDTPTYIGTSAFIASAVDAIRILVYGWAFWSLFTLKSLPPLGAGLGGALLGVAVGMAYLRRVPLQWVRYLVVGLLYLLGVLLAVGLI